MAEHKDLLIEIGTEELPPKALRKLAEAFELNIGLLLVDDKIEHGGLSWYASPRRLAVLVKDLATQQEDINETRQGPSLKAAYDDAGHATKAAIGFAKSCGVEVTDLEKLENNKGAWLVFRQQKPGALTKERIPNIVETALSNLPIPKRMRWGAGEVEFVRPVHWVVLLFGAEVIPASILDVQASNITYGHRFHNPSPITLTVPDEYAATLENIGKVLADFAVRRERISEQVDAVAKGLGGRAIIDADLLDEVTALVEWPAAIIGSFEEKYLAVPQEVLISTMQDNQKYFPVVDVQGKLLPHFIAVSNIESGVPDKVRKGNERVIRPRFSDAEFFWNQDRKRKLADHIESLKQVVFEKQLGSLFEKSQRVATLAVEVATRLGVDIQHAQRAAKLSKCDLMTDMVYEFPELQGIMGRYYAQHDGEPQAIADALDEQYMPRHAGDDLPRGDIGQVLSIADKLDTLVGIFAIGKKPSGAKDPYGLRRAALGVLRIIIERQRDLDLRVLINKAAEGLADKIETSKTEQQVFDYIMDRLKAYYLDRGIAYDVIDAVIARRPARPLDFERRVKAVQRFRELPEAESLAAANKRIRNILKKVDGNLPDKINTALLTDKAEQLLHENLVTLQAEVSPLFDRGDYESALGGLAKLRETVDQFFDDVMVMTDDEALRNNRIAMLSQLNNLFLRAADISLLQK